MHLHENTLFDLDLEVKVKQDVTLYIMWPIQIQRFRRRCIYKKLHYFTLTLQNIAQYLYIMWPF